MNGDCCVTSRFLLINAAAPITIVNKKKKGTKKETLTIHCRLISPYYYQKGAYDKVKAKTILCMLYIILKSRDNH